MNDTYFITGISTEVGKTISSAIVVESLQADYWKPIQSGDLDNSDTMKVKSLISNSISTFFLLIMNLTTLQARIFRHKWREGISN